MATIFGGRRWPSILRVVFVFLTYITLLTAAAIALMLAIALL